MINNGKLIIFSAPSGSGKTTIVKRLLEENISLEFSISACSRSKRENEVNGKDYYFLTVDEFKQKINSDEFVEWEEVYAGCFYGTLKSEVERIWKKGKHVIFDVDVAGGLNLKKIFTQKALAIFVQPPSLKDLENRLLQRNTETEESLQKRLAKAVHEMNFAQEFDKIILNDDLETAVKEAKLIVKDFLSDSK